VSIRSISEGQRSRHRVICDGEVRTRVQATTYRDTRELRLTSNADACDVTWSPARIPDPMSKKRRKPQAFESSWMLDAGVVRHTKPSRQDFDPHDLRQGRRPFIVETASERHLLFSHDSVQSTMRLDDPDALTSEYTRRMMCFLLFNPEPREILMIGLGGGSLAKFCYRHLRNARLTTVEIDSDVIALREDFCLPLDDARFRVVHADGARHLAQSADLADVIIVDAFDHTGVAPSLVTSDFYRNAASHLQADGVLVMNLSGEPSRYDAHLQRIHDAFGERTVLVPVSASGNDLLFAFKADRQPALEVLQQRAQRLKERYLLDFPRYLEWIWKYGEGPQRL
jgi:spermidine synthase